MPAASSNMANFTPGPVDYSVTHMLAQTFGDVTGNVFGVGSSAAGFANVMGTAFAYFNSAVLFFGTIILAYVTVFSIMNTANDGQVLGRKWSTVYTPLRIAGSAASLIPTTSGYSIIQLIVMQVVVWGVGIADTTYREVVAASLSKTLPNAFVTMQGDASTVGKLASDLLASKVCALTLNDTLGQITGGATNIMRDTKTTTRRDGSVDVRTVTHTFRDMALQPAAGGEAICGRVVFEYKTNTTSALGATVSAMSSAAGRALGYEATNSAAFTQTLANTMVVGISSAAFSAMDAKLTTLASQIYLNATPENKLYQEAINDYLRTLHQGYQTSVDSLNASSPILKTFLSDTTDKGWIFAGMWHRRLSQIQEALKDAYRVYPKSEGPNPSMILRTAPQLDQGFLSQLAQANSLVQSAIQNGTTEWERANPNAKKPGIPAIDVNFEVSDISHSWKKWTGGIGQSIVAGIIDLIAVPDTGGWYDPVIQVKNLGDWTMFAAETAITAKSILMIGLSVSDSTAGTVLNTAPGRLVNFITGINDSKKAWVETARKTVEELWNLTSPSMWGLLYVGYFMSIFLPMVPYLIFTLAVIGWLIAVVESVIAAPLWMVMHMTPEGNDSFIGSQQQGYLLLLSVFFRPVLTVVGLLASIILLRPIMDFVNTGFIGSMATLQSDSVTGIGSIFGYLLVYAFITLSTFLAVFALPQDVSDRVLKWIGAGIGGLGEREAMGRIESGASGMAREGLRNSATRDARSNQRLAESIAARKKQLKENNSPMGAGGGANPKRSS